MKSGGLDAWRDYFRTSNSNIFDIIENAIVVASSDCPNEFKNRRSEIVEKLYSCKRVGCSGCKTNTKVDEDEKVGRSGLDCSKERKVNTSLNGEYDDTNMNQISNYSYGEAEALTDEMEEEGQIFGEVLRIKEIIFNFQDESDGILFESLRRLQLMILTVDILKATEIGKAVNGLRKHGSMQIRNLARKLIDVWKVMVDEWVSVTASIAEGTPDSVNPSVIEDDADGLPSPPLDDGIFFTTQPTSMELSQFFDGMDDDGNPQNNGEFIISHVNERKPSQKPNIPKQKITTNDDKREVAKRQEVPLKPYNETKYPQSREMVSIQKRPTIEQDDNTRAAAEVKLEEAKRKLQKRYQQAENAKRQRTIQVMELHNLPKQGLGHKNPHIKLGNKNRHFGGNGRR